VLDGMIRHIFAFFRGNGQPKSGWGTGRGRRCGGRSGIDDNASMAPREAAAQHERLLAELNEERASALFRISGTLESLLAQLHAQRASLDSAAGDARPREVAAYRDLRSRALRHRWYLEVQRESLGLRHHARLDEFYQLPAPVE
jgi:hypothetical protein